MNSKFTMQVFGIYMVVVAGLGLMLMPFFLLGLFGLSAGDGVWIRMVGMLASIIGGYYLLAARADAKQLYGWSVWMRLYAGAFMIVLFVAGMLGAGILLFAAIDICAALWTRSCLRKEQAA
ncbi:hypothetical protein M3P21_17625 [Ruegeria sp. 2012CJ41-6]|uniref:Permease n=1 Tax=Ruegeria spongiae TaxID=2942209 RepID=A0ABT0Q658_9RHOB|nr:hypothetical protein [Ruegeria spongiae]MCL6285353.1 hypothetical protein [Ruegeria spongiae]